MAPSDDADATGIDEGQRFDSPVAGGDAVVDLEPAVVDGLLVFLAVSGRAAVLGRHHHVAQVHQLADDVGVVGGEVRVHAAVRQDQQRRFLRAVEIPGHEEVGPDFKGVPFVFDAVGFFPFGSGCEVM